MNLLWDPELLLAVVTEWGRRLRTLALWNLQFAEQ